MTTAPERSWQDEHPALMAAMSRLPAGIQPELTDDGRILVTREYPFGTVTTLTDLFAGRVMIWASPNPHPVDWGELTDSLRLHNIPDLGHPIYDRELDLWIIDGIDFSVSYRPEARELAAVLAAMHEGQAAPEGPRKLHLHKDVRLKLASLARG